MKHPVSLLFLITLIIAQPVLAQKSSGSAKPLSGLYLFVDAGLLVPNSKQANFYDGRNNRPNTINRVLHSEAYGSQIWNDLVSQQLISPSAIPDYNAFQVAEYANMYYKLTYQLGLGFRYVYDNGFGWLVRFDYSQVNAAGQFLLSSDNGTGILGRDQYVTCGIYGVEKRMLIDFALTQRVRLTPNMDLELDLGFDVNNTKVSAHNMRIGGHDYSILDVWNGQSPYVGISPYEYINQGAIGIGAFASLAFSYRINSSAIDFGYTLYSIQTKYRDYNEDDSYAFQHNVFVRFNINNFSFFK